MGQYLNHFENILVYILPDKPRRLVRRARHRARRFRTRRRVFFFLFLRRVRFLRLLRFVFFRRRFPPLVGAREAARRGEGGGYAESDIGVRRGVDCNGGGPGGNGGGPGGNGGGPGGNGGGPGGNGGGANAIHGEMSEGVSRIADFSRGSTGIICVGD
jgi:hypothetical protein